MEQREEITICAVPYAEVDQERQRLLIVLLKKHGCLIKDTGVYLEVTFPAGTRRESILWLNSHLLWLPDGFKVQQVPCGAYWFLFT